MNAGRLISDVEMAAEKPAELLIIAESPRGIDGPNPLLVGNRRRDPGRDVAN
jgi:hypothetical protein